MAIYFEERGNKHASTLVFIHGGGINGWMWGKQVEYFKEYHCLIPDLPEHGQSKKEGNLSIKDCGYRIAELIERYAKDGKADIVGHSLGAKIVVELLATRPELITHAVIASALFRSMPFLKMSHRPFFYRLTTNMLKYGWLASFLVKQFKFPEKDFEYNCLKEFQGLTPDSLYRIYDELYRNSNLPQGLENINVPTLVLAGEKEPKAMRQSVVDIANTIPNAKGIFLRKESHTYPWTSYAVFNKVVEDWVNNKQIGNEFIINCPKRMRE